MPKIKLKISRKMYFVPCRELTMAGLAKDMEKINSNSEIPAQDWPKIKIKDVLLTGPFLKLILGIIF